MTDRRANLLRGLDVARLRGLEIGPLMSPFVAKSDGDVVYVDHVDTAALRAKYAADPDVDTSRIVDVDAVWGERTLAECLGGRHVDYVVASHVVEHVPDLVTWLQEIDAVLAPGGELRLAVPDKRYTFDYLREEARFSDVVHAHFQRARRPLPHALLDCVLDVAAVDAARIHDGSMTRADIHRSFSFENALQFVRDAQAGDRYVDVHCWVVTPHRFATLMERLVEVGLSRFACAGFIDTVPGPFEFYAALSPATDRNATAASWRRMAEAVCVEPAVPSPDPAIVEELHWLRGRVAAMEASTSWRATAPLRALVSALQAIGGRRNG